MKPRRPAVPQAPVLLRRDQDWALVQPWGKRFHLLHGHGAMADAPGEELDRNEAVRRLAWYQNQGYKRVKSLPWWSGA